jgi:hypothetical protein
MIGYHSGGNNSKFRNSKEMTGRIPMEPFLEVDDDDVSLPTNVSLFQIPEHIAAHLLDSPLWYPCI